MIARRMMQAAGVTPNEGGGGANKLLDDLIAYWEMDETSGTRADSVGSLDLTDNNTVGNRPGINGTTAADFGGFGANEYLSLAHASAGALQFGDTDFTVACWLYMNSNNDHYIWSKYGSTGNRGYLLYRTSSSGNFIFAVSADGTNTNAVLTTGTHSSWHAVVCVHDSVNNLLKISVDNGAFVTAAHSGGVYATTADFRVGRLVSTYLGGGVQKMAIAGRCWDTDDISDFYNSGDGLVYADFESS